MVMPSAHRQQRVGEEGRPLRAVTVCAPINVAYASDWIEPMYANA